MLVNNRYNETDHPVLFQTGEVIKKNIALPTEEPEGQIVEEESYFGEDVSEEEEEEQEDVSHDKLIKSKKPPAKRKRKETDGASRPKTKRKTK